MKVINISWCRHAESCSNKEANSLTDKKPKSYQVGLKFDGPEEKNYQKVRRNYTDPDFIKASIKYHPNLSFVGMQHASFLGNNYLYDKEYDFICVSAMVRTIMTALISLRGKNNKEIYVVPFISEKLLTPTGDHQNSPLDSTKLKRMVKFIKDWLQNSFMKYYDDIYFLETLHNIKKIDGNDKINLNTINYINEILNCKVIHHSIGVEDPNEYNKCYNDKMNKIYEIAEEVAGIEQIPNNIREYMRNFTRKNFSLYIRGPNVNFSILEKYERNKVTNKTSIREFYSQMIPEIVSLPQHKEKEEIDILCYSHGEFIKEHFKEIYQKLTIKPTHRIQYKNLETVMNTEINKNTIHYNEDSDNPIIFHSVEYKMYKPKKIRSNYGNYEDINIDVCSTKGMKGFLNYSIWYEQDDCISSIINGMYSKVMNEDANPDIEFAFPEGFQSSNGKTKFSRTLNSSHYYSKEKDQIGGDIYHHKYLKYKQKYLFIKNTTTENNI